MTYKKVGSKSGIMFPHPKAGLLFEFLDLKYGMPLQNLQGHL